MIEFVVSWIIAELLSKKYHYSNYPEPYHEFVLLKMQKIHADLGGGIKNQKEFIKRFDAEVRQEVIKNPNMLNKKGW